jgi:hypothetical protein
VRGLREYGEHPYFGLWVKTQEPRGEKFRGLSAKIDFAIAPLKGQLVSEGDLLRVLSQGAATANLRSFVPRSGAERLHTPRISGYASRSCTHSAATVESRLAR